ncbi:MAG: tetratricopeptide repeat protein [Gemmatimonadota bacterium]
MKRVALAARPVKHSYLAGFSIAAFALVATTACGKKTDEVQSDSVVTPTSVSTNVDSGTVTPTVPVNVTFAEAESVYKERRYADATAMFDSYVQRKPENAYGHYMLGLSAWKAGELDRARSAFEKSLELDPKHVKTLLNLSRVLIEQGKPKEALTHVTSAVQLDSASGDVHRMMGRVRTELRQPNEAVESYRVALSLEPGDVWSMNNMALVLIHQGRFDEALPPLARAVQLDSSAAVFHNNLGIALERTGHYTMASESYRKALSVDSSYTKASASLTRVEQRIEDSSVTPINLAELAATFDREIRAAVVVRQP